MACKTSFELHHNFPKIAEESGFTFNTHKPRVHIEWNKIRLIDLDNLIRDRKFVIIEQHLNDILDCVLESEFDVRILDEGVLKIFRLAQLAVEYQQFCRHYLDRSVYVLREEITTLAQELDFAKKTIREKEDEIRKYKRKNKYSFRNPLPYGNDNIASIILQTLANKSEIFTNAAQNENVHYNKCTYCDKVFMNQLYLRSHLSRRHSNVLEIPQRDVEENKIQQSNNQETKDQNEITELKLKVRELEQFIKAFNSQNNDPKSDINHTNTVVINDSNVLKEDINATTTNYCSKNEAKMMKDAEIATESEDNILEKLEKWKKEEHEKYNKEISLLRAQITGIVDSYNNTDKLKAEVNNNKIMEELHETIKQQSAEIASLKEELTSSRLKSQKEESEKKRETEAQIAFWVQRTKDQSEEYKQLLQNLELITKQAQESREQAELEKKRATKLQQLLEKNINSEPRINNHNLEIETGIEKNIKDTENILNVNIKANKISNPVPDCKTLEKLHRRAQELLNQSISTSDTSNTSDNKVHSSNEKLKTISSKSKKKKKIEINADKIKRMKNGNLKSNHNVLQVNTNAQLKKSIKHGPLSKKDSEYTKVQESPIKVIRAKLTEEVNQRLVLLGIDPLKKSLPRDIFQKYRLQLQEKSEIKAKKNPEREKVHHSIMSYLDNKSSNTKSKSYENDRYVSPNRTSKAFSLTSVISNVKSKALALVKSNQDLRKDNSVANDTITKKTLSLLKTPPESITSSPNVSKHNYVRHSPVKTELLKNQPNHDKHAPKQIKSSIGKMKRVYEVSDDSDTNTTGSFQLPTQSTNKGGSPGKSTKDTTKSRNVLSSPRSDFYKSYDQNTSESDERESPKKISNAFERTKKPNTEIHKLELTNYDNYTENNVELTTEHELRNALSDENIVSPKKAKGVLKNASSMSSLYKKKVIFDLDAIQMKSVSASPSLSINENSNTVQNHEIKVNHSNGLGINPTDEWDISSIEIEPQNEEKTIKLSTRTSPKIAELKQSIESQLTKRNQTLSTIPVGGVDIIKGPTTKVASLGGSNTSLGSSILDDSESEMREKHTAFVKFKNIADKDNSEIDISELVARNENFKNMSF
ncbi:cilium assembly protein DZIP1L-like [Battus philenor]|uniref:cilium assembly protein DZIP1L-like n=1 Tax=Battus philenor TaxID=42288 RepID=UPI0035D0E3BE